MNFINIYRRKAKYLLCFLWLTHNCNVVTSKEETEAELADDILMVPVKLLKWTVDRTKDGIEGVKKVGQTTYNVGEWGVNGAKSGAKKSYGYAKKAGEWTFDESKKGGKVVGKVGEGFWDVIKRIAGTGYKGAKWGIDRTADGAKFVGRKVGTAGKWTYGAAKDTGKWTYGAAKDTGRFTWDRTKDVGRVGAGGLKAGVYGVGRVGEFTIDAGKSGFTGVKNMASWAWDGTKKTGRAIRFW